MGGVSSGFGSGAKGDMRESKKTICFLIFAVGKANGGHYRSLRTIAESMSEYYNATIINFGYTHSNVISSSQLDNHFVYFNGVNVKGAIKRALREIDINNIDILHSFDYTSLLLGKILSNRFKIPLIYTKCGGPNPSGYHPRASTMTVFSFEDYKYFSSKKYFKKSNINLIPNRVNEFKSNSIKLNELKGKIEANVDFVFLRICRISQFYLKSMLQSINLINYLEKQGYKVKLLIIGNIQDLNVYEKVKTFKSKSVLLINEDYFTFDAKQIVDVADFVIGTGRGFMEASSKGKIMLCPSSDGSYPILISDSNFETAFEKNFSERIVFKDNKQENLLQLTNLLNNPEKLISERKKSRARYLNYFSMKEGTKKYRILYDSLKYRPNGKMEIFSDWIFVVKNNLGTWHRKFKQLFNGKG